MIVVLSREGECFDCADVALMRQRRRERARVFTQTLPHPIPLLPFDKFEYPRSQSLSSRTLINRDTTLATVCIMFVED